MAGQGYVGDEGRREREREREGERERGRLKTSHCIELVNASGDCYGQRVHER